MRDRIRKRTKYLTVSAMLCALGVILLSLGSVIEVLDITAAVFASLLCIYAVIEMGGVYPWLIWLVTSFLALLLLPQKTPALFYALFAGFFPIVKEKLEKLPRIPSLLLKLVFFHTCLAVGWGLLCLFAPTEAILNWGWMLLATYVLGLLSFLMYDYALSKLITFYLLRLRGRLGLK